MKFQNILRTCYCYSKDEDSRQETGWDRVRRMYETSPYGLMSPELFFLIQNASYTVATAAVIGAFVHSIRVKEDYFRRNIASTYESQHLARRRLTDTISLSAIKGGAKYAIKYGSFSTLYLMSTMTVANYNNKISIWEHIGTGAFLGGIIRFNFGLKGMAAAASVGSFLGAFAGGILVLFMKLNNLTVENLREMQSEAYYGNLKSQSQAKRSSIQVEE